MRVLFSAWRLSRKSQRLSHLPVKECLACARPLGQDLTFRQLLSWGRLRFPVLCPNCQDCLVPYATGVSYASDSAESDWTCQGCMRMLSMRPDTNIYRQAYRTGEVDYCHDCYHWRERYPDLPLVHRPLFHYNDFLREWLYRYKYQGDLRAARLMIAPLERVYQDYQQYQWLVIPSAPASLAWRHFHPMGYLLDQAGIPYQPWLIYQGDGQRQAHKTRRERLLLGQSFALSETGRQFLAQDLSPRCLIFDDLYTTGATLIQAKRCLHAYRSDLDLVTLSLARDNLEALATEEQ